MTKELEQKIEEEIFRSMSCWSCYLAGTKSKAMIEHVVRNAVEMAREETATCGVAGCVCHTQTLTPDEIVAQILKDMEQGNE